MGGGRGEGNSEQDEWDWELGEGGRQFAILNRIARTDFIGKAVYEQ